MINLTPTAIQEIKRMQKSRQQTDSYFRISVINGGCSGLIYILDLDKTKQESDYNYESEGISIIIDPETLPYLQGLKLDYSEDLMGGGFRFQNPQANKTCNCGQSFGMN